jgi:transposase, IS5 family
VLRTVGSQQALWEAVLPPELLVLPTELARVDALLDDPAFFAPFVPFFDPRMGRPSTWRALKQSLYGKPGFFRSK